MRDRLQARLVVTGCVRDDTAFPLRMRRALQEQRNACRAHGRNAARVQNAAARGRNLLGFPVVQALDQPGRRHGLRIGAEKSRRVGPDLEPARLELAGEVGPGGVGAAAPEQHGLALGVACQEPLRQHDSLHRRRSAAEAPCRARNRSGPRDTGRSRSDPAAQSSRGTRGCRATRRRGRSIASRRRRAQWLQAPRSRARVHVRAG